MPNHVTHKIIFAAEHQEAVKAVCRDDGCIDFEKLVPSPPQKYQGNLSSSDEKDFSCNWLSWNRENWGTKWDAYDGKAGIQEDGRAFLMFDTAWSIPYPIISAFMNRFGFAFEHRYFDEGANFWGIETWGPCKFGDGPRRLTKNQSRQEDLEPLRLELKGYCSDDEEDDAA